MNVFLCHEHTDKDVVEPIGSWLSKHGLNVWIDSWRMTPGDSLVEKIGEGIEASDRLIAFLSKASVESQWVKKEIATGLVMELAEEKGLGEKFVIPVLLESCKIPILLRDKLYANFTNKAFDAACEELYRGILNHPLGTQDKNLKNAIIRFFNVPALTHGKHALVVEFAVRIISTDGLHIRLELNNPYELVMQWFEIPNKPIIPQFLGVAFTNMTEIHKLTIYEQKFSSPSITSTHSYYLYFEGSKPMSVKTVLFLDFFDRVP
jgi:hypothetical protein